MLVKTHTLLAALWAAEILARGDGLILDLETMGLAERAEVVQIGVIDLAGNTLLEALVRPSEEIPLEATALHGLGNEDVAHALTFPELYTTLVHLLTGRRLIAYNAPFDRRILDQTCRRYRLGEIHPGGWSCAMENYALFYGDWNPSYNSWRWQSLSAACFQQGIEVAGAHTAVADCRLTLELIRRMAAAANDQPAPAPVAGVQAGGGSDNVD